MSYTAFVGSKATMEINREDSILSDDFKNVILEITTEELEKLSHYLTGMVNKVPYNWFDSRVLMPLFPATSSSIFVEDVDDLTPSHKLSRVFCSQMGCLSLRNCLDPCGNHKHLVKDLKALNSRLTSPHTLYMVLRGYGDEIDGNSLHTLVMEKISGR